MAGSVTAENYVQVTKQLTIVALVLLPQESMLPQLLQFVTGSARVPVGGFSELAAWGDINGWMGRSWDVLGSVVSERDGEVVAMFRSVFSSCVLIFNLNIVE